MRILVVEDDPIIASRIAATLETEGYTTQIAYNGEEAKSFVAQASYGLVVLDVMMPKMNGLEFCQYLRSKRDRTPVLMLTARDTIDERVQGLDAGADDYLVKPFDVRELTARVRALVRRDWVQRTGILRVADLELDTNAHVAKRAGQELKLTKKEYVLLEILAKNEGRIVTRALLMDALWQDEDRNENTINFHIASLRKKVDAGEQARLIHTMHGLGYSLRSTGEAG